MCQWCGPQLFTPKARHGTVTPFAFDAAAVLCFMLHGATPAKDAHTDKDEGQPVKVAAGRLKLLAAGLAGWFA